MREWNTDTVKFGRKKTSEQLRIKSLGIQKDKKRTRYLKGNGMNMRTEKTLKTRGDFLKMVFVFLLFCFAQGKYLTSKFCLESLIPFNPAKNSSKFLCNVTNKDFPPG